MSNDRKHCEGDDYAIPVSMNNGEIVVNRHRPDHTWEQLSVRVLEHGKPIHGDIGEVFECTERPNGTYGLRSMEAKSGPAQVATNAYRAGWDTTFGKSN
jgi:hypothetical protein